MPYTFPGNKQRFGQWTYYTAQLTLKELIKFIKIKNTYKDLENDPQITTAMRIRYMLNRNVDLMRVKSSIQRYLYNDNYRFFSSIIVGTMDGNINFSPVDFANSTDIQLKSLAPFFRDKNMGVIVIDEESSFYALDGQHRLSAIKGLIGGDDVEDKLKADFDIDKDWIDEFSKEVINVIFVPLAAEENRWAKYRKLFSTLNRYAKPINEQTIIAMSEDDIYALLTRKLLDENDFFAYVKPRDIIPVDVFSTTNMKKTDASFTNLITLNAFNKQVIKAFEEEINDKYGEIESIKGLKGPKREKAIEQIRPDDEFLEKMYKVLDTVWNCLLTIFPSIEQFDKNVVLEKEDEDLDKRKYYNKSRDVNHENNNILMFPAFQNGVLGNFVKERLRNIYLENDKTIPDNEEIANSLKCLKKLPLNMRKAPWDKFLTTTSTQTGDPLVFADRATQIKVTNNILSYIFDKDIALSDEHIELLKQSYRNTGDSKTDEYFNESWKIIEDIRSNNS